MPLARAISSDVALHALEELAKEVWALDWRVASEAATY